MQAASSLIKQFLPRLGALLFIILFLSALTLGPRMLNIDGDLPRHLLMGKFVLENGTPPQREIFSYVYENRPYTPQEWLSGVIYYVAYLVLDLNGVVLLASILIAATFTILYQDARSQNARSIPAFLLLSLGAFVTSIHWITRPHLFTMFFLAIWLIWAGKLDRGLPVQIWKFPVLMVLWANIHGEFIAGFLILGAYLAGWVWRYVFDRPNATLTAGKNLLYALLLSLPASGLSPAGFRTWNIVSGYVTNRYLLTRIAETHPPDFSQAAYWPQLLLLLIPLFLMIGRRVRFPAAHLFLLIGFGAMSLVSARNAHLLGVVYPFVLIPVFKETPASRALTNIEATVNRMESQAGGTILPILLTILLSASWITGPLRGFNRFEPTVFPVDAVQWLESHPSRGRMFNAFDWGSYILLHLWPEQKTFIESHTDVTGEATQKYEAVITLQEGWHEIFESYDITWVIVPPEWPLVEELVDQGWQTSYQDQTTIILIKK